MIFLAPVATTCCSSFSRLSIALVSGHFVAWSVSELLLALLLWSVVILFAWSVSELLLALLLWSLVIFLLGRSANCC